MDNGMTSGAFLCLAALATALASPAPPSLVAPPPPFDTLTVVAPAAAGGGWDQTAHAMREALLGAGVARQVEIVNSPGAGGAIGLAQFVNARRGDGQSLLVGGLVMVGAIHANRANISLLDATPIARLTGDHQVIAVRADSEFRTVRQLLDALRADPASLTWAGGSEGGIDDLLVRLVAREAGVEAAAINYQPFPGGGQAAAALLEDRVSAAVSGWAEFEPYVSSGKLRALAVSSERRIEGVSTPTLREQGIDVAVANWRGVFGPPGLDPEQKARLAAAVAAMVRHPSWTSTLRAKHWTDSYLEGEAFARFVAAEEARVRSAPDPLPAGQAGRRRAALRSGRWLTVAAVALLALALGVAFWVQRARAARREQALSSDLQSARQDAQRLGEKAEERLRGLGEVIDRQFAAWGLTSAEREVAHLMLKGLKHREIADVRNTSERTVRQQALAIYKKAGLEGRTDLAAYFLEDLLAPEAPPRVNGPGGGPGH